VDRAGGSQPHRCGMRRSPRPAIRTP
jgi:hypothetical protein